MTGLNLPSIFVPLVGLVFPAIAKHESQLENGFLFKERLTAWISSY
jgi:hypothetical protein